MKHELRHALINIDRQHQQRFVYSKFGARSIKKVRAVVKLLKTEQLKLSKPLIDYVVELYLYDTWFKKALIGLYSSSSPAKHVVRINRIFGVDIYEYLELPEAERKDYINSIYGEEV